MPFPPKKAGLMPDTKPKPQTKPVPSQFSRQQAAEDTERAMTGRPQKFGAAVDDDDDDDIDPMAPDPLNSDKPPVSGQDQGPMDPEAAPDRQTAEDSVRNSPPDLGAHHEMVAKHNGSLKDIFDRLAALEAKNGGGDQSQSAPMPLDEEDGR